MKFDEAMRGLQKKGHLERRWRVRGRALNGRMVLGKLRNLGVFEKGRETGCFIKSWKTMDFFGTKSFPFFDF